jgi:hypothetical protein
MVADRSELPRPIALRGVALIVALCAPAMSHADDRVVPLGECFQCLLGHHEDDDVFQDQFLEYIDGYGVGGFAKDMADYSQPLRGGGYAYKTVEYYTLSRRAHSMYIYVSPGTGVITDIAFIVDRGEGPPYGLDDLQPVFEAWGVDSNLETTRALLAERGVQATFTQDALRQGRLRRLTRTTLKVAVEPGNRTVTMIWADDHQTPESLEIVHIGAPVPAGDALCAGACFECPDALPWDPWTHSGVDLSDPATLAPIFTPDWAHNQCELDVLSTQHGFTKSGRLRVSADGVLRMRWRPMEKGAGHLERVQIDAQHLGFLGLDATSTRQDVRERFGGAESPEGPMTLRTSSALRQSGLHPDFKVVLDIDPQDHVLSATFTGSYDSVRGSIEPDSHIQGLVLLETLPVEVPVEPAPVEPPPPMSPEEAERYERIRKTAVVVMHKVDRGTRSSLAAYNTFIKALTRSSSVEPSALPAAREAVRSAFGAYESGIGALHVHLKDLLLLATVAPVCSPPGSSGEELVRRVARLESTNRGFSDSMKRLEVVSDPKGQVWRMQITKLNDGWLDDMSPVQDALAIGRMLSALESQRCGR